MSCGSQLDACACTTSMTSFGVALLPCVHGTRAGLLCSWTRDDAWIYLCLAPDAPKNAEVVSLHAPFKIRAYGPCVREGCVAARELASSFDTQGHVVLSGQQPVEYIAICRDVLQRWKALPILHPRNPRVAFPAAGAAQSALQRSRFVWALSDLAPRRWPSQLA